MTIIIVGPNMVMRNGNSQVMLCAPLPTASSASATEATGSVLKSLGRELFGWWDASTPSGILGVNATVNTVWNSAGTAIADLSGNQHDLLPHLTQNVLVSPIGVSHLSGVLGGAGYPISAPTLLQPALSPDAGWQASNLSIGSTTSWTLYCVWSRPNWRQGSNQDNAPAPLVAVGETTVLQVDSQGGSNRLVLFPGSLNVVLSSTMARRHTHSIIVRYSPEIGVDVWLDNVQVCSTMQWPAATAPGNLTLLHDGTPFGAAQCWLHEASVWLRSLSNVDVATLLSYAGRWIRGARKGIYLVFNGQSNAINYSLNDGAAALLAQGIAWHLGALAYNVLATTANATSYTMQSGHGIYTVSNSGFPYPGSFVEDPDDGSSPSGWPLGADGLAVQTAITSLPQEDLEDVCAIVWPWNETDSLRNYSELQTFQAAAARFLSLVRTMLGQTSSTVPLLWWNAIPYGTQQGISMHRQAVEALALDPSQGVVIVNPQTSDSNARGSSWDPTTGLSAGGDSAHRDSVDNQRFAILASSVGARALIANGYGDTITSLPDIIPTVGGPRITHAYQQSPTTIILTIGHDSGTDLEVPLQATTGIGFAVMDGGSPESPGNIISGIACQRIDATHLQIELGQALQNTASACQLYYPYGPIQIGRGNAVTDNYAKLSKPTGWDSATELGSAWVVNFPLAATLSGIILSTLPA